MATARTDSRSLSEKWSPTPNIRRMTPISESSWARLCVGDEAGRMGTDEHAGDEVADERRQSEPVGERAEDEREHERCDDGRDQGRRVRHRLSGAGDGNPGWLVRPYFGERGRSGQATRPLRNSSQSASPHGLRRSDAGGRRACMAAMCSPDWTTHSHRAGHLPAGCIG